MDRFKIDFWVCNLRRHLLLFPISLIGLSASWQQNNSEKILIPIIDGEWWKVAGNPDLGSYTTEKQQPVDFALWQAEDGTWQIWSCIRGTNCGGKTRLFYRWQGTKITDTNWHPMGIAMEADTSFGETLGGLQAPFVMKIRNEYHMFYGDWENICMAKGVDGKTFARQLQSNGKSGMFTEGPGNNTRDVNVIRVGALYIAYYTAYPNKQGADYVRTSKDFKTWSTSKIVAFGGSAGSGSGSAECPYVYFHKPTGYYYLFRTQRYGANAQTSVYRSKDPLDFGVNDDRYLVTVLPVAAPEIVDYQGQIYIAALLPSLKGIQIAKIKFVHKL
ncbi:MAG: hypothetical protein ABSF81_17740 [Bacteroidales bacterium]